MAILRANRGSARGRRNTAGPWLILTALLAVGTRGAAAQSAPDPGHQVEAVFLYHFTQFVTWPPEAFESAQAPLVVGVLGEDPFGDYLDQVMRGEEVGGHPLAVRRYRTAAEAAACHILFVGAGAGGGLAEVLRGLQGRPILTVSDADDFARAGGMIQFTEERGRIRFRINVDAARAAGLTISSKLLRLADIVSTGRT